MEGKIITRCSNCQAQFKLGREKIGKKIKCPKCANIFVVEESTPKAEAKTAEKIITQCSSCQAQFKLGSEKIGKKIKCPKCSNIFVVEEMGAKPKPEEKAAAPEAAPTPPAEETPAAPAAKEVVPLDQRPRPLSVRDFLETQHTRFIPEKAQGADIHVSYTFVEKGKEDQHWTLKILDGTCEVTEGADPTAKSQVKMKTDTYLKLATDKLDSRVAFMLGKMKIKGDKSSLGGLRECFQKTGLKDWK